MRGPYFNSDMLMPKIMMLMKMTTTGSWSFISVDAYKRMMMMMMMMMMMAMKMTTMGSCSNTWTARFPQVATNPPLNDTRALISFPALTCTQGLDPSILLSL